MSGHSGETVLSGGRLALARLAWSLVALLALVTFIPGIPVRLGQLQTDPYSFGAAYDQLGITVDFFAAYYTVVEVLFALLFAGVGTVIFWKASDDWMALLVSATFIATGVSSPLTDALAGIDGAWHWPVLLLRALTVDLLLLILYLFPDGRFVPAWTRWLAALIIVYTGLWFFLPALVPPIAILTEGATAQASRTYIGLLAPLVIGIGSQIYRYRAVSNAVQRQQTKWVVLGFVAFFVGLVLILLPFALIPALREPGVAALAFVMLFGPALLLAAALVPLSFALAILRYRLWDISLVVRRTLVYSLLTAVLTAIYFGSVVLLQELFRSISREQSPLVLVLSTLVIAALFAPLRRGLQGFIDRRFYRRKYNAQQLLARFAQTARNETDLEQLTAELLNTVQETMQPAHVSLWLRPLPGEASGPGVAGSD